MAKKYTVLHKKSNVLVNGEPKLPSANTLQYGEIAINYAVSGETLSIKNAADEVVEFASKNRILSSVESALTEVNNTIEKDEEVIAVALNDLGGQIRSIPTVERTSELINDSAFVTTADTADFITGYTETDPTVPAWAKADNKPTYTASEVGAMATSERSNYLTTATTIPNVDNYFDDVEYDSNTKRINFKHGSTVKDYIDATDFIKDGMVSSVTVSNGNLVITFNTEAGRENITLSLSQIFDPDNYYTKTAANENFLTTATSIPTETSIEASGFTKNALTGFTETDPTVPSWAKAANKPSYTADEVGAMAVSERSNYSTTAHTHEQYSLTSHTHTAAEVGAMATSERGNYLTTATTIPTEASIEASGFTKNALTGYTETDPTVPSWAKAASKPSYTAAEVGAMATSERSNYATTAHTHTAAEVGAMATSERGNYLPTGTTLDNIADGTTRKLSDYSTTGHTHSQYATTAHTHTAAEVGAMATSERSNYLTTATTIPTESSISGSGFTKNAITGITFNGTAVTVTDGVAAITAQTGGGSTLPSVTAADNGKVLMVVDGAWAVVMPTTVYTGTDTPLSSIGNDGDIYLQTS